MEQQFLFAPPPLMKKKCKRNAENGNNVATIWFLSREREDGNRKMPVAPLQFTTMIYFSHHRFYTQPLTSDKSYTWSHSNNTNTLCCGLVHAVLITQSAYYSSTLRWNRIYISFRLCASYTIRQRIHHHVCNKNVRECVFFANLSLFHFYFL